MNLRALPSIAFLIACPVALAASCGGDRSEQPAAPTLLSRSALGSPAGRANPVLCFGRTVETSSDVENCGGCASRCPAPLNADATCTRSRCGRGSCYPGFFDLDRAATFGCEATCEDRICTDPSGARVRITNLPLHERDPAFQVLVRTYASRTDDSTAASLGEDRVEMSNATHSNTGGFIGEAGP